MSTPTKIDSLALECARSIQHGKWILPEQTNRGYTEQELVDVFHAFLASALKELGVEEALKAADDHNLACGTILNGLPGGGKTFNLDKLATADRLCRATLSRVREIGGKL